ncbi:hypothetical protein QAD02_006970 [Eretmocerus hayati]|uniref:Uncharacterized protein n=1 Tax=Eretmocerus hayati TaxID=131215 RepID=A0ACC2N2U6_9HYME|nr:hypothetical protein QAD02_006970 [Eretmocerus hayati]
MGSPELRGQKSPTIFKYQIIILKPKVQPHQSQSQSSLIDRITIRVELFNFVSEPKKRRFHPLRGLRRIFRKKSRGAADSDGRFPSSDNEAQAGGGNNGRASESCSDSIEHRKAQNHHALTASRDREHVTARDPAGNCGRSDEARSRSASELLTDSTSTERDRLFTRRRGTGESSLARLQRGTAGHLSVSHDSVFPGEAAHERPLSSLDLQHTSLERRSAGGGVGNGTNDVASPRKDSHTTQRHRISLRVLEQIKTVIENRNQIATTGLPIPISNTTTITTSDSSASLHSRIVNGRDRGPERNVDDSQAKVPRKDAPTPTSTLSTETPTSPIKEDLPDLATCNLNHTAAHHRISVRPKNRRPPRIRPGSTIQQQSSVMNTSTSSSQGLPRIDSVSEISIDTLDSLEATVNPDADNNSLGSGQLLLDQIDSPPTTPKESSSVSKPIPILRKTSSRLSRNSEVFEELEAKLPTLRKSTCSPDSLETSLDGPEIAPVTSTPTEEVTIPVRSTPPKPSPRTASTSSSSSSSNSGSPEEADKSPLALAVIGSSTPRRRCSSNRLSKSPDSLESSSPGWLNKSNEGFDNLLLQEDSNQREAREEVAPSPTRLPVPIAASRKSLQPLPPLSKSQERVCRGRSADSLEQIVASEPVQLRRSSCFLDATGPIRAAESSPRRSPGAPSKLISKSTECFESAATLVERRLQLRDAATSGDRRKRASVSEINLSRGGAAVASNVVLVGRPQVKPLSKSSESFEKISSQQQLSMSRRLTLSSESSAENPQESAPTEESCKLESRTRVMRLTPKRLSVGSDDRTTRLHKSSESCCSELGSTDTLDSEHRRNIIKSSDSDETLDSLERDPQLDLTPTIAEDKSEEERGSLFWRRRTNSSNESTEPSNLDIHQLLTNSMVVTRTSENGNNEVHNGSGGSGNEDNDVKTPELEGNSKMTGSPLMAFPKRRLGSDDNKILSCNLQSSKADEDLQNMLNGNLPAEVQSTDTRSFKEKLIMFEKLGK